MTMPSSDDPSRPRHLRHRWIAFCGALIVLAGGFLGQAWAGSDLSQSPGNLSRPGVAGHAVYRWRGAHHYKGFYYYPDNRKAVPFTMDLRIDGAGEVTGRAKEPATFGNGTSSYLYANIVGSIDGNHVFFTKTYDGTGGVTHSVQYQGTIDRDGSISGSWRIGDVGGGFDAHLAPR
jgi:hypothetical protein